MNHPRRTHRRKLLLALLFSLLVHGMLFVLFHRVYTSRGIDDMLDERVTIMVPAAPAAPKDGAHIVEQSPLPSLTPPIEMERQTMPYAGPPVRELPMPEPMAVPITQPSPRAPATGQTKLSDETARYLSQAELPVLALADKIGFDMKDIGDKGHVTGYGKRTYGYFSLSMFAACEEDLERSWTGDDLRNVCRFISEHTGVTMTPDSRYFTLAGRHMRFDRWVQAIDYLPTTGECRIEDWEAEADALACLEQIGVQCATGRALIARTMLDTMLTRFFFFTRGVVITPAAGGWDTQLRSRQALRGWDDGYLQRAEQCYQRFNNGTANTPSQLKDIYLYLRLAELMRLPVLFYEPKRLPVLVSHDNLNLLGAYVKHGGCICLFNSADRADYFTQTMAVRGFINDVLSQQLLDSVITDLIDALSTGDNTAHGHSFFEPQPLVFHPYVLFPFVLQCATDVSLRIYSRQGRMVFADTLRDIPAGQYLQRTDGYKWYGTDDRGVCLPSDTYVYQIEAGLARKTGAVRLSRLRRLEPASHDLFKSHFVFAEPPLFESLPSAALPYQEPGVYGVMVDRHLAMVYAEGYKIHRLLRSRQEHDQTAALRWLTNVVICALGEGSIARM